MIPRDTEKRGGALLSSSGRNMIGWPHPNLTTRPHASTRSDLVTRYLLSLSGRCSRLDCFGLGARGRNSGSSFSWGGISSSSRGNLRSYTCTSVQRQVFSPGLRTRGPRVSFGRGSTYPCASRYPSHARAGYRSSGPCEDSSTICPLLRMMHRRLSFLVLAMWAPTPSLATWLEHTVGGGGSRWGDIASSSDGTKLAATVAWQGDIWLSINSGVEWVQRSVGSVNNWEAITSSSDGTKLAAVVHHYVEHGITLSQGQIWFSFNSGASWSVGEPHLEGRYWKGIASSSDGTKVAAVEKGGGIWISTNSANSFNLTSAPSKDWLHITSSSDGTKLAAVVYGENIWTSDDSGLSWIEHIVGGSTKRWRSITSSSNGTKLAAAAYEGNIWTSTDSGDTWFESSAGGTKGWSRITSSSDGTRLAAIVYHGYVWTSMDSGITWVEDNLGPKMGRSFCSGDASCHPGHHFVERRHKTRRR